MKNKSKTILFSVIAITPIMVGVVLADDFRVTPSISLQEEYNDNILFASSNELDDFITTLTPAITILEKTERLEAKLNSKLDVVGYADNDAFNAFETKHDANFSYKFTPLLSTSASGMYSKDSRPDRDLDFSGLVLSSSTREKQNYTLGGNWIASEKIQAGGNLTWGRSDFEDTTQSDSTYGGVALGLLYNLEEYFPKTVGRTNFSYIRYNYTTTITKNFQWTFGFEHNLTEKYTLTANLGPRYTESDSNGRNGDDWGIGGDISFGVQLDELADISFSLSQEQADVSGSSGTTERTAFSVKYNRRIYEEFTLGFNAEYRKNKSESSISILSTDEDYYSISPRLTYKITNDLSVQTVYRFTEIQQNSASSGEDRKRNLIYAKLTYKYPLFD